MSKNIDILERIAAGIEGLNEKAGRFLDPESGSVIVASWIAAIGENIVVKKPQVRRKEEVAPERKKVFDIILKFLSSLIKISDSIFFIMCPYMLYVFVLFCVSFYS